MQVIQARCPNCGATLAVDERATSTVCAYCGTSATIVPTGLALTDGLVVMSAWGHLQAFDRRTGEARWIVGEP